MTEKVYLLHYFSAGDFTHRYGAEQRLYRVGGASMDDASRQATDRKGEFERDTQLRLASIRIYEVADEMDFDLNAWLTKQREAQDRAEYDRLKAKFEGGKPEGER